MASPSFKTLNKPQISSKKNSWMPIPKQRPLTPRLLKSRRFQKSQRSKTSKPKSFKPISSNNYTTQPRSSLTITRRAKTEWSTSCSTKWKVLLAKRPSLKSRNSTMKRSQKILWRVIWNLASTSWDLCTNGLAGSTVSPSSETRNFDLMLIIIHRAWPPKINNAFSMRKSSMLGLTLRSSRCSSKTRTRRLG